MRYAQTQKLHKIVLIQIQLDHKKCIKTKIRKFLYKSHNSFCVHVSVQSFRRKYWPQNGFSTFDSITIKFTSIVAMISKFWQQSHLLEKSPVATPPQVLVTLSIHSHDWQIPIVRLYNKLTNLSSA